MMKSVDNDCQLPTNPICSTLLELVMTHYCNESLLINQSMIVIPNRYGLHKIFLQFVNFPFGTDTFMSSLYSITPQSMV